MRTVWVSFDTIGRDCLEAAADVRAPRSSASSRCRGRSTRIAPASARSTRSRRASAPCCTRRVTSTPTRRSPRSRQLEPELVFVVGWSQLVRDPFIELASEGVFGMHPTLLPRHRGRAPIPWAILTGLARTGVTLFEIADATADSGAIVGQREVEISPDETATTLFARVADAHVELVRELVPQLVARAARRASRRIPAVRAPGRSAAPPTESSTGRPARRTCTTGCARRRGPIPARSRSSGTRG